MGQYKFQIGDRFRNSAGNLLEIIKLVDSDIHYKYVEKETEQPYYTINRDILSIRLERTTYYDYTPISIDIVEELNKSFICCGNFAESKKLQAELFNLGLGYRWDTGGTNVSSVLGIQIGSRYMYNRKTSLFIPPSSSKDRITLTPRTGKEVLKLINNYLNSNQNAKDNKNKPEVNRPNHSSNSREISGTTVKVKGAPHRVTGASRLNGNPIKVGRVKGKTRHVPIEGRLLSF